MSTPYGSSGAKTYIGGSVTTPPADATAYNAVSWTQIVDVEDLGEFGDEAAILEATSLDRERVFKTKGARNAGTLPLVVLHREDDSGQQTLVAAEQTRFNYPFKVVLPNRLTTGGTDQIVYFTALVSSQRLRVGDAQQFVKRTYNLAINSVLVNVSPT